MVYFGKALVSCCCPSVYGGDKAVGDSMGGVVEVTTLVHVEDCLSQTGGDWGVVFCCVRCDTDLEWGR